VKTFLLSLLAAFSVSGQVWSVAQIGDLHVGSSPNLTISTFDTFQNFLLTHTNDGAFNFVGVISPGDLYEQNSQFYPGGIWATDSTIVSLPYLTNFVGNMIAHGLFVDFCPGNHDADFIAGTDGTGYLWKCDTNALFWNTILPLSTFTNTPAFAGTQLANDSRSMIFKYHNILFLSFFVETNGLTDQPLLYSNQCAWINSQCAANPDKNVFVMSHYFLSARMLVETNCISNGYLDAGPSVAVISNGVTANPNLLELASGHVQNLFSGHTIIPGTDGHAIDVSGWNMQNGKYNGSAIFSMWFFRVWTFDDAKQTVTVNTYSFPDGGFLTNLDARMTRTTAAANTIPAYYTFLHNWTVPFAVPKRFFFST